MPIASTESSDTKKARSAYISTSVVETIAFENSEAFFAERVIPAIAALP